MEDTGNLLKISTMGHLIILLYKQVLSSILH